MSRHRIVNPPELGAPSGFSHAVIAGRTHFGRYFPAMGLFGIRELFEPGAEVELMGVAVLAE
jgi:hypothetical protein